MIFLCRKQWAKSTFEQNEAWVYWGGYLQYTSPVCPYWFSPAWISGSGSRLQACRFLLVHSSCLLKDCMCGSHLIDWWGQTLANHCLQLRVTVSHPAGSWALGWGGCREWSSVASCAFGAFVVVFGGKWLLWQQMSMYEDGQCMSRGFYCCEETPGARQLF